jgi:hypothetical protein
VPDVDLQSMSGIPLFFARRSEANRIGERVPLAPWRRRPRVRELLENGPDWARTSDPALIKRML